MTEKSFTELLTDAMTALEAVTQHEDYQTQANEWFSSYSPDMVPGDGLIGCQQLLDFLNEDYENA